MVLCAGTGKGGPPRSLRRAGSSRERLTGTLPRALAQPVPSLIAGPRLLRWSASHQLGLSASLYAFVLSRVALLGSWSLLSRCWGCFHYLVSIFRDGGMNFLVCVRARGFRGVVLESAGGVALCGLASF